MAFRFPRNPRKSIYDEKCTKDCYSSFVFFPTHSPSFVITDKQYLHDYPTLVAFYIEPITARLLDLIEDDEFNVDNFMTYHLSMPIAVPGQLSPLLNLIEQDTPLTSNLAELTKIVRSRQLQRINVGDSKNIPQQTSFDDDKPIGASTGRDYVLTGMVLQII